MLSLVAALFCIFMKQWLDAYSKWTNQNSFRQGVVLRGFYQAGLQKWHILDIFAALGVLLQLVLGLFVVGLVGYLWTLNSIVSPFVTALAALIIALSASTIILPGVNEDCPYKSPLARGLLQFRRHGPSGDWADRDMPIAQRRFNDGSIIGRAVNQTALLLDVLPELVEKALINVLHPEPCTRAVGAVRDRVRQLSPTLAQLLAEDLTSSDLLKEHTAALSFARDPAAQHMSLSISREPSQGSRLTSLPHLDDLERLYCLWKIVLCATDHPRSSMSFAVGHLIRHLADTSRRVEPAIAAKHHVPLIVDLFLQCGELVRRGELPVDESIKIALVVDDWAETCSTRSAVFTALRTLFRAASNIPQPDVHSWTTTGVSPVMPYLRLLERLRARTLEATELLNGTSGLMALQYDLPRDLTVLVRQSTSLYREMMDRHVGALCIGRKAFRAERGATEQPRIAVFASDSCTLYVGTDEAAAWAINLHLNHKSPLTLSHVPRDSSFHLSNFTRDGRFIIWGSRDGPMLLSDKAADEHVLLRELGQGMHSRPIAVSRDDGHVLIASELNSAVLLNAKTRELVRLFEGHSKRVAQAAFGPSPERLVATSSFDNTVKVWNVDRETCLATFSEIGHSVNAVAWSPDGSMLAISSAATIRIFDWKNSELQATFEGHTELVTGITFSPAGELLASCSNDKTVRVWSLGNRRTVAVLDGPSEEANSVDFAPDGSFLACAADDGVWLWEINPNSKYRVKPSPGHAHEDPGNRLRRVGRMVGKMQNVARQFQVAR